jgi:hypothetical protein
MRARSAMATKEAMNLARKRINTSLQDRADRGQREARLLEPAARNRLLFGYGSQ